MSPGMPTTWNLPAIRHAFDAIKDGGQDADPHRVMAESKRSGATSEPTRSDSRTAQRPTRRLVALLCTPLKSHRRRCFAS